MPKKKMYLISLPLSFTECAISSVVIDQRDFVIINLKRLFIGKGPAVI